MLSIYIVTETPRPEAYSHDWNHKHSYPDNERMMYESKILNGQSQHSKYSSKRFAFCEGVSF